LRVPVNILLAGPVQLQEPGNNANINLNQIGGSSVSSALYGGGNNALKVNCIVGCSAAGSFTDNSAFTTGSTSVTNVSGLFNDTATNLTSGNAGAIRATTDRMLFVNIGKIGGTVPTLTGSSLNVNCTGGCSSSAGFTDNSTFTAGTTTETNVGGVFNDGLSALSSGNPAAARITPNRGVHVNLRNNSGTEIATSGNPLRIDPTGTTTQPVSGTVTVNIGTTNGLALDRPRRQMVRHRRRCRRCRRRRPRLPLKTKVARTEECKPILAASPIIQGTAAPLDAPES
jgi:hypothetical protein